MLAVEDVSVGLNKAPVVEGPKVGPFSRVVIDSRSAQQGDLFVALRGERHDGHDFLDDAIARGAAGVVVARPVADLPPAVAVFQVDDTLAALQRLAAYWRARQAVRVVAVTGSVGKTTCKELIAAVLGQRYPILKSEANLNTEIGLPLTLLALTAEHSWAVLEMAMYARGEIALLCDVARPDIGVVTNIEPVHLGRLGSMEEIVAAKGELVEALPPDGIAVLNGDDPRAASLARRARARVLLYGTTAGCDLRATDVTGRGREGISFRLAYGEESAPLSMPLPGRHHVYPALAAAAVAVSSGFTLAEAAQALASAQPPLRLRLLPGANGSTLLDDSYNASPASVLAALDLLSEMKGRRLALLGDMLELGTAETEAHRQAGEAAARACDDLLLVG
ncbi:MAG: UDP-N-acetylmuramoyl-tripeptide--D-alanyl-D-alanine ligase, partial [Dehalococcoidia bacterium]